MHTNIISKYSIIFISIYLALKIMYTLNNRIKIYTITFCQWGNSSYPGY